MGGKSDPPPPPDYSALINASKAAADQSAQIAMLQLDAAQKEADRQRTQDQPIVDAQVRAMDAATQAAASDRAFWERNYAPVEEQATKDALTWDQPANVEKRAAQAGAEVATQYGAARNAAEDTLKGYGIRPDQIQAGALDLGARIQQAGATAQAINTSRDATTAQALQLRQNTVATGRGLQGTSLSELGAGVGAGTSAISGGLASDTAFMGSTMNPLGWQSQATSSLGQAFDMTHGAYGDVLAQNKQANDASSGVGKLLGTALGVVGGKYMSTFATGGSVGADHAPPAMDLSQQAGAIPMDAGPRPGPGGDPDTVHAMVSPGEYVIPRDAATSAGTDQLDKWVFNQRVKSMQQRAQHQQAIPTIQHPQGPQPPPAQGQAQPGGANIPRQALPMVA